MENCSCFRHVMSTGIGSGAPCTFEENYADKKVNAGTILGTTQTGECQKDNPGTKDGMDKNYDNKGFKDCLSPNLLTGGSKICDRPICNEHNAKGQSRIQALSTEVGVEIMPTKVSNIALCQICQQEFQRFFLIKFAMSRLANAKG